MSPSTPQRSDMFLSLALFAHQQDHTITEHFSVPEDYVLSTTPAIWFEYDYMESLTAYPVHSSCQRGVTYQRVY
ncbi:hypothetical protein NEOLEDRAFT_1129328 [Neolentinus lepideus HHB14362 ss-1]|uniref:Uncharacterized protein n=1 Tax=Neolentinus lepideus HHB14362 ss-1 TaxID=1314782 RepID=A0A165UQ21_9AGAM|nr:hypothetical protein NEOLEDRAFT_1129328 [Neolentinus lepideus HHB14362 ss-1]